MPIQYFANREITAEQAIALYRKTSLGERRPVDSPETFEQMLKHANLIVTAWDENRLVGISRTLTDFVYVPTCQTLPWMKATRNRESENSSSKRPRPISVPNAKSS